MVTKVTDRCAGVVLHRHARGRGWLGLLRNSRSGRRTRSSGGSSSRKQCLGISHLRMMVACSHHYGLPIAMESQRLRAGRARAPHDTSLKRQQTEVLTLRGDGGRIHVHTQGGGRQDGDQPFSKRVCIQPTRMSECVFFTVFSVKLVWCCPCFFHAAPDVRFAQHQHARHGQLQTSSFSVTVAHESTFSVFVVQ